jgi:DNA-binding winged helix-turn-helix (wHTH) protein
MKDKESDAVSKEGGHAAPPTLVFGQFRLETAQRLLFRDDAAIRLGGRAMELLVTLTERAGEVLSHGELEARIWPCTMVEDSTLRVHIAALRRALGNERYIANVPGRGYSFVGNVERRLP